MAVRDRPAEPLAKTYFTLTGLFIVSVIAAIGSGVTLAALFAYSLLPGASEKGSSRGVLQDHPTIALIAGVSLGIAVLTGITLAILDRVLDR